MLYVFYMWYIIKAQHASDSSTPKISHTVSDIAVKTPENRSDKPDTFYHISPTKKSDEETFSLGDSSVNNGELRAEFASKLKFDDPKTKSYTLEHDEDDDIPLTHAHAKILSAEIKALTALGCDKPPPEYSFFATPTVSDTDTASVSKSTAAIGLLPADSDVDTGTLSTIGESFELSAVGDHTPSESVGLSASGVSKTLDVATSRPR